MATASPPATQPFGSFVAEVRAEMGRQGLNLTALATRLDMASSQLHRRLTGKSTLSLIEAYGIADVLGVPLHELAARAEQAAPAL